MGLLNGEIIGEDGLTYITLVRFDLNNLGILLLHSLNLCVQFGCRKQVPSTAEVYGKVHPICSRTSKFRWRTER